MCGAEGLNSLIRECRLVSLIGCITTTNCAANTIMRYKSYDHIAASKSIENRRNSLQDCRRLLSPEYRLCCEVEIFKQERTFCILLRP